MPKIIEYPRASFAKVKEMAAAIDYLGGSCTQQSCADRLGVKLTGAFAALVGAAKKHELIDVSKGSLSVTQIYRDIKLAYTDEEKLKNLQIAFLSPPLYRKVYEKFIGKELPVQMLDKLMIREFGVDQDAATRVSNYFIDGAKSCEILIDNKIIDIAGKAGQIPTTEEISISNQVEKSQGDSRSNEMQFSQIETKHSEPSDSYIIHISGPDINSRLTLSEQDDFLILDAMISKLKKKVKEN